MPGLRDVDVRFGRTVLVNLSGCLDQRADFLGWRAVRGVAFLDDAQRDRQFAHIAVQQIHGQERFSDGRNFLAVLGEFCGLVALAALLQGGEVHCIKVVGNEAGH